jgi:hypothetical protein
VLQRQHQRTAGSDHLSKLDSKIARGQLTASQMLDRESHHPIQLDHTREHWKTREMSFEAGQIGR